MVKRLASTFEYPMNLNDKDTIHDPANYPLDVLYPITQAIKHTLQITYPDHTFVIYKLAAPGWCVTCIDPTPHREYLHPRPYFHVKTTLEKILLHTENNPWSLHYKSNYQMGMLLQLYETPYEHPEGLTEILKMIKAILEHRVDGPSLLATLP